MRVLEKSEYHFLPALKIPLSRNIAFISNVSRSGAFFVRMKVLLSALKFKIIEILRIALSVGKLNFAEDETASFCISSLMDGKFHCIFQTLFSADQPALLPRIRRADLEQGAVFGDGAAGDFVAAFSEEVGDVLVGEASGAGGTAFEDERNLTAHGIA